MSADIVFGQYLESFYPFEIEPEYTRTATYVVGSPNMGKSTLLGHLAEQFCAAGEGVLLLDIKGDLAKEIASRTRQPERVIYVKMGEIAFPHDDVRCWTINPFEGHRANPAARTQIAVNVLESFERMGRAHLGTMANIRNTLEDAIELALVRDEPTLLDLLLIVFDQAYRQHLLAESKYVDHVTARNWRDLDDTKMPARERRGQIGTTRNRLGGFLRQKEINLTVGRYASTLKLKQWLDEGKMILVDLGLPLPRHLGIDLGNMIVAQLVTEIFLRGEAERPRTWRIMVDEFHLFVGTTFANIITDARSYNVFPVLAHQDRGQLRPNGDGTNPVKTAVGHAEVSLNLRGSREDRVALASLFGQDIVDMFFSLKKHSAIVNYYSSLAGNYTYDTILLNDWWGVPDPGQLADLQMAALPHTISKRELVSSNRRRYWDYLDGAATHAARNDHVPRPRRQSNDKAGPPAEIQPRPITGQAVPTGSPPQSSPSPARPGVARPARAVDQRDAAGPALPRPPRRKPGP